MQTLQLGVVVLGCGRTEGQEALGIKHGFLWGFGRQTAGSGCCGFAVTPASNTADGK